MDDASVFVPAPVDSTPSLKRPRKLSVRACDRCYSRKVRCPAPAQGVPCRNCTSVGLSCTFGMPQHRNRAKRPNRVDKVPVGPHTSSPRRLASTSSGGPEWASSQSTIADLADAFTEQPTAASSVLRLGQSSDASTNAALVEAMNGNLALSELIKNGSLGQLALSINGGQTNLASPVFDENVMNNVDYADFSNILLPESLMGNTQFGYQPTPSISSMFSPPSGVLDPTNFNIPQFSPNSTPSSIAPTISPLSKTLTTPPPLTQRMQDELVDIYFNFINPALPFLHHDHFVRERRQGRVPPFLLDCMYALAMRYVNPVLNYPERAGLFPGMSTLESRRNSTNNSSQNSHHGSNTHPATGDNMMPINHNLQSNTNFSNNNSRSFSASSTSSTGSSSSAPSTPATHLSPSVTTGSASPPQPRFADPDRGWADVELDEFLVLNKLVRARSLEWVPKLLSRSPALSAVHSLLIIVIGEMGRSWCPYDIFMLQGAAIRMATFLGINNDTKGTAFERNIRRRTWWSMVVVEVLACGGLDKDTNLPMSYVPPYPELDGGDGSATGAWSPEATRSFIALADLCARNIKFMRRVEGGILQFSTIDFTVEYLEEMRQWELLHAKALTPPRLVDGLLRTQDVYPWILTTFANIFKNTGIVITLRPAAFAFLLGAQSRDDWAPHIRQRISKQVRPSYSAWLGAQNATLAIREILQSTPSQVLSRQPFLHMLCFGSVIVSFQTLIQTTDPHLRQESAIMLASISGAIQVTNPWGKGMVFNKVTEFCLEFARKIRVSSNCPAGKFSKTSKSTTYKRDGTPNSNHSVALNPVTQLTADSLFGWDGIQAPTMVMDGLITEITDADSNDTMANSSSCSTDDCTASFGQGMFEELCDPMTVSGGNEVVCPPVTNKEHEKVQEVLLGSLPEVKRWLFSHVPLPKDFDPTS